MRKLSILFILSLLVITVMPACRKVSGHGPVVSETRSVSGFQEVKTDFTGDVFVTQGSNYNVRIEAQQNIIDVIETVLNDGILTIRGKSNTIIRPDTRIKVYVTMPRIDGLMVNGSGNTIVENTITTSNLYMKVSGSGNITVPKLDASSVDANISGSGEINIWDGTVSNEYIDITGSGDMDFSGLRASTGEVRISGSGDARVYVTGSLKVRISGSGDVYYRGTPSIDVSISGSGKLRPL
jgi:hypothetical protein